MRFEFWMIMLPMRSNAFLLTRLYWRGVSILPCRVGCSWEKEQCKCSIDKVLICTAWGGLHVLCTLFCMMICSKAKPNHFGEKVNVISIEVYHVNYAYSNCDHRCGWLSLCETVICCMSRLESWVLFICELSYDTRISFKTKYRKEYYYDVNCRTCDRYRSTKVLRVPDNGSDFTPIRSLLGAHHDSR